MKKSDMHDFASGSMAGKPLHVPKVPKEKFGETAPKVTAKSRKFYGEN